jgi:sulfatase modifying factor 1
MKNSTRHIFPGLLLFSMMLLSGCDQKPAPSQSKFDPARSSFTPAMPFHGQSFVIKDLALEMRLVAAGRFLMGSVFDEAGRTVLEAPLTNVILTKPFWLGRTEVTYAQWRAVMGTTLAAQVMRNFPHEAEPVRLLTGTDDAIAMYFVSWQDAMDFCAKLNARARAEGALPAGYEFRLPTEAEWEYACRAGTTAASYAGPVRFISRNHAPVLDGIAWYSGNSSVGYTGRGWDTSNWAQKQYPGGSAGVRSVGLKAPNALGLHDMLGNVYEWFLDYAHEALPGGSVSDPAGPERGIDRIVRGGSWHSDAAFCRSAYRTWNVPDSRLPFIGFRIALAPVIKR